MLRFVRSSLRDPSSLLSLVALVATLSAVGGCGSDDATDTGEDTGEVSQDAVSADGTSDGTQLDAGDAGDPPDIGDSDVGGDTQGDAQQDAPEDAPEDTGADVPEDAADAVDPDVESDADAEDDTSDVVNDVDPRPEGCGDRVVDRSLGEECDDGNLLDTDQCTNQCIRPSCGDGIRGLQPGEVDERLVEVVNLDGVFGPVCEQGGSCPDDTCNVLEDDTAPEHAICQSLGYPRAVRVTWGGNWGANENRAPRAGNWSCFDYECFPGPIENSTGACGEGNMLTVITCEGFEVEACDDGENGLLPNQCRPGCVLPSCGDGVRDDERGEQCDDGNDVATDGCHRCLFPQCGDGIVQAGEECDDANLNETDLCRSDCTFPVCGDGILQGGERQLLFEEKFEDGMPDNVELRGAGWFAEEEGFRGSTAARSSDAGENASGSMVFTFTLETPGVISFDYELFARECCDRFEVLLNGAVVLSAEGDVPPTSAMFNLAAGDHELVFTLVRDGTRNDLEVLARVDNVRVDFIEGAIEECDDGERNSELPDACRPSCRLPACGDLIIDSGEECDDGNDVDDDGCSNACVLPTCGDGIIQEIAPFNEACDDGPANSGAPDACRRNCQLPTCGDGITDTGEACDDGNDVQDDGCSNLCRLPGCLDGVVQPELGEECDDGNNIADDGCSNECLTPQCGDGLTQDFAPFDEECDDANDNDSDGCRNSCALSFCGDGDVQTNVSQTFASYDFEADVLPAEFRTIGEGWFFTDDAFSGLQALVSADIADDESTGFEFDVNLPSRTFLRFAAKISSESCCDRLNIRSNDELLLAIAGEPEWENFTVILEPGVQTISITYDKDGSASVGLDAAWLDAVELVTPEFDEECDDGMANADVADVCRTSCRLPTCMDGIVDTGEECDDGNDENDDGCSNACALPVCGDGLTQGDEECDDADENNDEQPNACRTDCRAPSCTDGVIDDGEECDDGNTDNADGCSNLCRLPACGDGYPDLDGALGDAEECDDGNDIDNDGCSNACTLPVCGDGIRNGDEACDDANDDETDACRSDCTLPFCGDGIAQAYLTQEVFTSPIVESPLGGSGRVCDDGSSCPATACPVGDDGSAPEHGICQALGFDRALTVSWGGGAGDTDNPMPHASNWSCVDYECGPGGGVTTDNCVRSEMLNRLLCQGGQDEECDDGEANGNVPDACRLDCSLPFCGDGIVDSDEECDDANDNDLDECTNACTLPVCGDGIVAPPEVCDDGNTEDGDDCASDCTLPNCGDGEVDPFEQCDDGNDDDDDLCSNACEVNGIAQADENIGSDLGTPVLSGSTGGAGNDHSGAPECAGGSSNEIVVSWTPPAPGTYDINLCGSAYDTYLYARVGAIDGPIAADARGGNACNDDDAGFGGEDCGLQSRIQIDAATIEPYAIFVEGFTSNSGAFTLNISEVP